MAANQIGKNVDDVLSNTEDIASDAVSSVKNVASNVADTTTAAVTQATESAKKALAPYTTGTGAIYGLVLVILIAVITSYALYVLVSDVLFKKTKEVVEATRIPLLCNEYRRIPITTFSNSGNGQRRSYCFWIYINDMNKYNGLYKHVLHVGDDSIITTASPYIFLDKSQNKLYVRLSLTAGTESLTTAHSTVANLSDVELTEFMKQGIIIPYIPIQRWVHVAIVINENVNGGTITAYVDGDISNIVSNNETVEEQGKSSFQVSVANLNIDKKGDLYVGGSATGKEGPGFSGLISKYTTYNYDLNQKDIYKEYNEGPIDGLLAKLGLGSYGIRSPIYRIV